jgi:hypothetical protein
MAKLTTLVARRTKRPRARVIGEPSPACESSENPLPLAGEGRVRVLGAPAG